MARARICPQRIIKEAIRLLEMHGSFYLSNEDMEARDNNIQELDDLQERLYQQGIINL